jgi:hypothetical protein
MNIIEDSQRLREICFTLEHDLGNAHQRIEILESLVLHLREKLGEEILCRELTENELDFHKDSLLERNKEMKALESAMMDLQHKAQVSNAANIRKEMPIRILSQCVESMEVDQRSVDESATKKRKIH